MASLLPSLYRSPVWITKMDLRNATKVEAADFSAHSSQQQHQQQFVQQQSALEDSKHVQMLAHAKPSNEFAPVDMPKEKEGCTAATASTNVNSSNTCRKRRHSKMASTSSTSSTSSSDPFHAPKPVKRKKSTEKERLRNLEIKARLKELTEMMPFVGSSTELPRIRILRLANQYILHLRRILQGEFIFCERIGQWRPLEKEDFAQTVNAEMQIKNSYSHRIELDGMASGSEEAGEWPSPGPKCSSSPAPASQPSSSNAHEIKAGEDGKSGKCSSATNSGEFQWENGK